MADIFDEVNEDLRAERARQFAMRYGGLILAALLLVLVGVGAWQAWRWKQNRDAASVSATFLAAMRATTPTAPGVPVADTPERAAALNSFNQLASTAPDGYRSLARLRAAALRGERAHDGPRGVRLDRVGDEVRRALERGVERARLRGDGVHVVNVRWRPDARVARQRGQTHAAERQEPFLVARRCHRRCPLVRRTRADRKRTSLRTSRRGAPPLAGPSAP